MSAQTQQMIMGLLMWVAVFGVFYFLLIRPNRTKVPFEKWAIGTVESKESKEA